MQQTKRRAAPRVVLSEAAPLPEEGRRRVGIESVQPQVDAGRFPIKRSVGEEVVVHADAFADGHEVLCCILLHRSDEETEWRETRMEPLGNDRWTAAFRVTSLGTWHYTVAAWVDRFRSWRHDLEARVDEDDIAVALQVGHGIVMETARRADGDDARSLKEFASALLREAPVSERRASALDPELQDLIDRHDPRTFATRYARVLSVLADRERARFGAWYEFFPRSCGPTDRHGRFRDCEDRIVYAAEMGFDVIYLPPIHPVGRERRKGPNNTLQPDPGDPGSPWAIGAAEGGHVAIHPELGTLDDFRWFRDRVSAHGMELALDIAFQCAPDHPWVSEHPDWFRRRPDGSIQYAENPPRKYEDIYPLDFETADWQNLWRALEGVFRFWANEGVRIFRVDNPHTKPFPFWEWTLASLRESFADLIFLSEAFTRPRIMHRLAKLGFNQSYTYFAWRNTKKELTAYATELAHGPGREYMRPNLWPNTPDILTQYLQFGGRAGSMSRLTLAATLGASYGVYGPAFELLEHSPARPGSEEYLDSEKYQLRDWRVDREDSLRDYMAALNRIRRDNPALHHDSTLRFLSIENPQLIAYAKVTADLSNVIVCVVNLDPHHTQTGWVEVPLADLGMDEQQPYQMHDLLRNARYLWHGRHNYVSLDPAAGPAHVFRMRRRVRTEHDFEYYL
jgi:starch synthase (maltosyl-transferring)